jgi:hypothetical protein
MTLMLIIVMKSHGGQKLYVSGPILLEETEEAIFYRTNR